MSLDELIASQAKKKAAGKPKSAGGGKVKKVCDTRAGAHQWFLPCRRRTHGAALFTCALAAQSPG